MTLTDFEMASTMEEKETIGVALWNEFLRNDLQQLHVLGVKWYWIGIEQQHDLAIALAKRCLGSSQIRQGKDAQYLFQALLYFERNELYDYWSETLNEIGVYYQLKGNYVLAKKYFLEANHVGAEGSDPTNRYIADLNLAQTLFSMKKIDQAIHFAKHYLQQALKDQKFEAVSNAYAVLANFALEKNESQLRSYYLKKAFSYALQSSSRNFQAHAYTNQAILHYENQEKSEALQDFKVALDLHRSTNHLPNTFQSLLNLSLYYTHEGQEDKALGLLKEALALVEPTSLFDLQIEVFDLLVEQDPSNAIHWKKQREAVERKKRKSEELDQVDLSILEQVARKKIHSSTEKSNLLIYGLMVFGVGSVFLYYLVAKRRKF